MTMHVDLTLEEYEALVSFARAGAATPDTLRIINKFLVIIEERNNIHRYFMWVQWQETDYPLPPGARFPDKWPPELRCSLERTDRPIAKADVDKVLASNARRPATILVTTDPAGLLGWTTLDDYFKG